MRRVFTSVEVFNRARGGTVVQWAVDPRSGIGGAKQVFRVEVSLSGVGNWEVVGEVVDHYLIVDPVQRIFGKNSRVSYRVAALVPGGDPLFSPVKHGTGNLRGSDLRTAMLMVRREEEAYRLRTGQCGYLYKRRHWGQDCERCRNFDTGQVTINPGCPTCYGTGFTDGYFNPVEYWVSESAKAQKSGQRLMVDMIRGTVSDEQVFRRGIACPQISSRDVWIDGDTDVRYYVDMVLPIEMRGVPLFYDPIGMRPAPATDLIYDLPRPD